jgi:hypothetical protein
MRRITADRPVVVLTVDGSSPSASTLSLDPLAAILESIEESVVLMRSDMYPCYRKSAAERLLSADADHAVLTRELRSLSRIALDDISPHTARHHTENVLAKLSVHGRGEVAQAILAGTSETDKNK